MSEREASFAIREGGDGLFIEESLVVPYNEQTRGAAEVNGLTEEFRQGSFQDHRTAVIIDQHYGVPISGRLPAREDAVGWWVGPGRLLDTERAREFVLAAREGVIAPSIEFDFRTSEKVRTKTGVAHTRVKTVGAVAATYHAAYSGSFAVRHMEGPRVTEISETPAPEPTPPTPAPAPEPVRITPSDIAVGAQRIADETIRQYAARNAFSSDGPADPFAEFRGQSFGSLAKRAIEPGAKREHR